MTESAQARVAELLAERRPEDATRLLERVDPDDVAELVAMWEPATAARVTSLMVPQFAARCVAALPADVAAGILGAMSPGHAARVLRGAPSSVSKEVVDRIEAEASAPILRLLAHPAGTVGAVMDPLVATVPADVTASEAVELIRATTPEARSYVYITSRDGSLVGVATVAELAFSGAALVRSVMRSAVDSIPAGASLDALAAHPALLRWHQLPVVAPSGQLLGAVRYEVVRRIEAELGRSRTRPPAASTAAALGSFYALGVAGMVSWMGQLLAGPEKTEIR